MTSDQQSGFVRAVRERLGSNYHGIPHNGNDHRRGPLDNCPGCVTEQLLARIEGLEEQLASDERSSASIHLTLDEADQLAEWLKRAKDAIEAADG